jgi:SAM-dependent methyltransferase
MNRVEYIKRRLRGKILDAGYYACTLHEEILGEGGKEYVYGLDTETKKETKHYKRGSVENKFPFNSNEFDTIIAGELIEHLHFPEKFLKEANRVLKKGGILIITTPNSESLINKIFHNNEAPLHFTLFNTKTLTGLLKRNGFEIQDFSYMPYTIESSGGSRKPWSFPIRKIISFFLPKQLKEELVVTAKKIRQK